MKRALAGLIFVCGWLMTPAAFSQTMPSACPTGTCSGLGQSFYIRSKNLLDVSEQISGSRILRDTAIGTCATVTKLGASSRNSEEFTSTNDLTKSWSAGFGLGNKDTAAGGTNIGGSGFDLTGTASVNLNRSSTKNESFNSFRLYYKLIDSVVDLNQDSTCFSAQNLDPAFLADLEGLPVSDPKNAAENSSWADYRVFLERWGSHIQVKQELGSQLSFWNSEDATEKLDIKTLQANACFKLGGYGIALPVCSNFGNSEKASASQKKTVSKLYISGGDAATRAELLKETSDPVEGQKRITNFIDKAAVSDQAVAFKYMPIWGLLTTVYRQSCGQDGKGSKACDNFQRAVNLQAAYEGFLAYECVKSTGPGDFFVQGMVAEVPNGNGIYYYACKQARTGCHSDNDCTNYSVEGNGTLTGWFKTQESFCGGGSCIDALPIEGTGQYRSIMRPLESPLIRENADLGVNASCRNDSTATCDLNWGGGKPERMIWVQSTGGGGSGTFGAKSLLAKAGASDPAEPPLTAKVTVQLVDRAALNQRERQEQQKKTNQSRLNGDENRTYVTSSDPRSQILINCGGTCEANFIKGEEIQLHAEAKVGARKFHSWSDNICANGSRGKGRLCVIKVDGDITVQAYYD